MTLLRDLDAFLLEHRCCGDLDADVAEDTQGRSRIWMTCNCGACLNRDIAPGDDAGLHNSRGRVGLRSAVFVTWLLPSQENALYVGNGQ